MWGECRRAVHRGRIGGGWGAAEAALTECLVYAGFCARHRPTILPLSLSTAGEAGLLALPLREGIRAPRDFGSPLEVTQLVHGKRQTWSQVVLSTMPP